MYNTLITFLDLCLASDVRNRKCANPKLEYWDFDKCQKLETRILRNLKSKIETQKSEMRKEYDNGFAYANIESQKYSLQHFFI